MDGNSRKGENSRRMESEALGREHTCNHLLSQKIESLFAYLVHVLDASASRSAISTLLMPWEK